MKLSLLKKIRLVALRCLFQLAGPLLPDLLARLALKIYLKVPRYPVPTREIALSMRGNTSYLDFNGEPLQVMTWGEGPTVLLVHGWAGRGTQFYRFVTPLVKAGFRVVLFDGPGHGKSKIKQTDMFQFTKAIIHVAQQQGELAGVIGHSFGAACAVWAMQLGLSVPSAVLIASPADAMTVTEWYAQAMMIPDKVIKRMRELLAQRYHYRWQWSELNAECMLKNNRIPLFVVHDENDKEVPVQDSERINKAADNPRLLITQGLGHKRILHSREIVQQCIKFVLQHYNVKPMLESNH